ncbi:hypothetical protein [Thermomonospora umbrina]|uniref:Uncharacterized protein n=1 Tax=Thermomonospora umbrina TaxID=111806 RepID=A0A3D9SZN7_9ACTN|nr:hypothetical protein [Thermomonospora umbrina]REE97071.1 hypothetical protein DFJ69_2527 [Thermomonospora umbrina]
MSGPRPALSAVGLSAVAVRTLALAGLTGPLVPNTVRNERCRRVRCSSGKRPTPREVDGAVPEGDR